MVDPKRFEVKKQVCLLVFGTLLALLFDASVDAQMSITSTITGSVKDPSGQMVSGALVTVPSQTTTEVRTVTSNEVGAFNVVAIRVDTYDLKIEQTGFKAAIRTGIKVSANQRLDLGDITLQVGAVSESVTVEADSAKVATDSSEQSAQITTGQIQSLTARGRDIVSLMRTIPGVGYLADADSVGGSYGTKRGGSEFDGSAYWFVRNERLNANDFFNNRNGVERPEDRYNTERPKVVGGKLTIWTELDSGPEIDLTIPGATAYVKSERPFWCFGKHSATETDEKEKIARE